MIVGKWTERQCHIPWLKQVWNAQVPVTAFQLLNSAMSCQQDVGKQGSCACQPLFFNNKLPGRLLQKSQRRNFIALVNNETLQCCCASGRLYLCSQSSANFAYVDICMLLNSWKATTDLGVDCRTAGQLTTLS